jgi:putative chitinase
MKFDFSVGKLKKVLPNNRDIQNLHSALVNILPKYDIDTMERVSMFIGQCAHESGQFNIMTENLNYSVNGLLKTFPKYFNAASARIYARNPEKIANRVYANRMGNGNEASGDGWRFRGQGFIQLTGRSNHQRFADFLKIPLDQALVYVRTLPGAIEAACWFWKVNNLNQHSDRLDIKTVTKIINGGFNGLDDRVFYVRKAYTVFGSKQTEIPDVLKIGDKGPAVFDLQDKLTRLGYPVSKDGDFGKGTENAVKQFQKNAGLPDSGIVDAKTRMYM